MGKCSDHKMAPTEAVAPESIVDKFGYCFPTAGQDTEGNDVGEVAAVAFGGPQWHARKTNLLTEEDETNTVCSGCNRPYIFPEVDYEDAEIYCHKCEKRTKCINVQKKYVGISASFFFKLVPVTEEDRSRQNTGSAYALPDQKKLTVLESMMAKIAARKAQKAQKKLEKRLRRHSSGRRLANRLATAEASF